MQINTNKISFTSRNQDVEKADKLMRRIRKSFPTFSPTYLHHYAINKKNRRAHQIIQNMHRKMNLIRLQYRFILDDKNFFHMFDSMMHYKLANCYEQSSLTNAILSANNFSNVKTCAIVGYNKKRNKIIDCDHLVTVTNLKLPRDYEKSDNIIDISKVFRRHLIKPNNEAIIIDTWAGMVGNAKSMMPKYRGEIPLERKPCDKHELFLLPIKILNISDDVLDFINPDRKKTMTKDVPSKKINFFNCKKQIKKFVTPFLEYCQDVKTIYTTIFQNFFSKR